MRAACAALELPHELEVARSKSGFDDTVEFSKDGRIIRSHGQDTTPPKNTSPSRTQLVDPAELVPRPKTVKHVPRSKPSHAYRNLTGFRPITARSPVWVEILPTFEFEDGRLLGRGVRSTGTITLTVEVDGVVSEKSYPVAIVSPYGYAGVNDWVKCDADAHGGPSCPHVTQGVIVAGSPNVQINDLPAARVGDGGSAGACCGTGVFTVTSGDPTVLINGRHAAMIGSVTKHCGGQGRVATGYGV